ncbi:Thioesterase superfamily protein [Perilla frutescens var. hirtella]|uniref:Acyl-coenzyme A thioesterase 13 n=1 Tax=Perilla frutescens var. hirtella TaxID=608512 RepID=A0AAD4PFH2_PERFH|nr:Thioesterase superfamily protein [Perilla frutescens var. hirtella]
MDKDKVREFLSIEDGDRVSRLSFPPHEPHLHPSFYEYSILRGVRLDSVRPGSTLSCSFTVPPRLSDRNGKLGMAAIASLVDEIGAAVIREEGKPMDVSVDMSISYISDAKINDELEIRCRCLGRQGGYHGTHVLIRNKTTGEVVAEGRHSLFSIPTRTSKM